MTVIERLSVHRARRYSIRYGNNSNCKSEDFFNLTKIRGEINEKIHNGSAIVMTVAELKQKVRDDGNLPVRDVDVVTTGTFGVISGMH